MLANIKQTHPIRSSTNPRDYRKKMITNLEDEEGQMGNEQMHLMARLVSKVKSLVQIQNCSADEISN